jgi:hypothetical protein
MLVYNNPAAATCDESEPLIRRRLATDKLEPPLIEKFRMSLVLSSTPAPLLLTDTVEFTPVTTTGLAMFTLDWKLERPWTRKAAPGAVELTTTDCEAASVASKPAESTTLPPTPGSIPMALLGPLSRGRREGAAT